jgi:hypothetical protein
MNVTRMAPTNTVLSNWCVTAAEQARRLHTVSLATDPSSN